MIYSVICTDEHLKTHVPGKYIQADQIQCMSPGSFLNFAEVNPQDLNLLVTDTEGFDGEIVRAFLKISYPDMIIYEHNVMSTEENSTLLSYWGIIFMRIKLSVVMWSLFPVKRYEAKLSLVTPASQELRSKNMQTHLSTNMPQRSGQEVA